MRFSYQVGMCDPDHYLPLARAAEEAGYDGIAIPDSICYPEEASSKYPYNADGSREFLESVPFVESLIAVAAMAAVTEKIRFATFVYKLAVRQAPVVAKQVQGIQTLSGNRLDFGVGISPWEEDFAVCDVPWEKRGKRLDEQIEILRGLETGEFFGFEGDVLSMPDNKMCPVPTAPTAVLIGGHAEPALKRAARVGDGWMCAGADMQQLDAYITRIGQLREEYGDLASSSSTRRRASSYLQPRCACLFRTAASRACSALPLYGISHSASLVRPALASRSMHPAACGMM